MAAGRDPLSVIRQMEAAITERIAAERYAAGRPSPAATARLDAAQAAERDAELAIYTPAPQAAHGHNIEPEAGG
jgi:hypothetical protein